MSQAAKSRVVKIVNPHGLHARPAYRLAELARQFDATVTLRSGDRSANMSSVLDMLAMCVEFGTELSLWAVGADADAALAAVVAFFESDGEPETSATE